MFRVSENFMEDNDKSVVQNYLYYFQFLQYDVLRGFNQCFVFLVKSSQYTSILKRICLQCC